MPAGMPSAGPAPSPRFCCWRRRSASGARAGPPRRAGSPDAGRDREGGGKVGPGAEAPGSVSTAALPQDAYAARRASMTTLSLAFSFWPCCLERGSLAPNEEYLPQSRIVPCRSKIKLAEPLPSSRSCFAPIRSTLATPGSQRRPFALIPVRYPGQGARGGGAGHCPRVLKRYYEPVINRASILTRVLSAVQCCRRG
jgi:hypothetical protein